MLNLKDSVLEWIPSGALNRVLPYVAGKRSPFRPEILETGIIFIHVPKAGGTSLKTQIYGAPGGGHRRIAEFAAYDLQATRRFFRCSFVRNPWDRILSAYSYLHQGKGTSYRDKRFAEAYLTGVEEFGDFILALENPTYQRDVMIYDHFRPQSYWICLPGRQKHALNFLGRFETLEADMARLCQELDVPTGPITRARASHHPPYREAYTPRTRDIVAKLYAQDIAMLDYTF